MLMGSDLFEAGMTPVDITYSPSVVGDAASVTVNSDGSLTVTAGMVSGPATATVTIRATAERQVSSFIETQTVSNTATILFPVNVDLVTLTVKVESESMEVMEGGSTMITATASRMVETGDDEVKIDLVVAGPAELDADEIVIAAGSMSGSVMLTAIGG